MIHIKNLDFAFPINFAEKRILKKEIWKKTKSILRKNKINQDNNYYVLKNINIKINDGERIGLIGNNGSGKSTFLKLIAGIFEPLSGSIEINRDVSSLLDLNLGIFEDATGLENISYRLALQGLKHNDEEKIQQIIDFADIGDFINMPVRAYSSGMKLRLAFSTLIAQKFEILALDEWLYVGDALFQKKIDDYINNITSQLTNLFIASHVPSFLERFCTKAILLHNGEIIEYSNLDYVLKKYQELNKFTY
jgi:ABC-type polysaccharide/polyol phosphate transport system ATPase subunit